MRCFTSLSTLLTVTGLLSAGCSSTDRSSSEGRCRATLSGTVGTETVNEAWVDPSVLGATSDTSFELDIADDSRRLLFLGKPSGALAEGEAFLFGPGALGTGSRVVHASRATAGVDDWNVPVELGELTDLGPWPGQPVAGSIEICSMSGIHDDEPRCHGHAASLTGELDGQSLAKGYVAAGLMYEGDAVVAELYGPDERVVALLKSGFALLVVTRVSDGVRSFYTASSISTSEDPWVAKLGSIGKLPAPPGTPLEGTLTLERCR